MNINEERVTLKVSGLHCANCALKVEKALYELGLSEVEVDLESNTAKFINSNNFETNNIISALKKSGYPSKLINNNIATNNNNFNTIVIITCLLTAPLLLHMFFDWHLLHNAYFQLALTTPVFIIAILHFGSSALGSIKAKSLNMDVLVITGVIASYVYSVIGIIYELGENYLFFESAATITCFVLIGNWIEKRSMQKTTSSLKELVKLQLVTARKFIDFDKHILEEVSADTLLTGNLIQVNDGDRIPCDGLIIQGSLELDESMLTGESKAIRKNINSEIIGGSLVLSGSAIIKVTKVGAESILGNIISLVKNAQNTRPNIQRLGDLVSSWFVPIVILIAVSTFFLSYTYFNLEFQESLMRAIAVIVIACPCAMGLAVPTAVSVALGRAAKSGILFKSGQVIENLAKVNSFVFDKTGTLTENLVVESEKLNNIADKNLLINIIYTLEQKSSHPIAKALVAYYKDLNPETIELKEVNEIKGEGISAIDDLGNTYFVGKKYIAVDNDQKANVYIYKNDCLIGSLTLADRIKKDASFAIKKLISYNLGLHILSGDSTNKVKILSEQLNIPSYYAEQTPQDKLKKLDALQKNNLVAYVGDGINDAPALSKAHVGIALSDATQIALSSAQIVINHKELNKVVEAYQLAKITLATIKQNLFWAFFYNIMAIPMAMSGYLTPTLAALVMGLSDVIVIGNSLRLKNLKLE
jgi:Cu+-exporting ATPase